MTRKKENDYLHYKNPIHVIWRKGTPEDEYVDKLDIMPVVNQRIILSEIPDYLTQIKIPNMTEINHERFIDDTIEPDEYYCDYSNGFVYFHKQREAETLSVAYKGRGIILYPSTRIVHINGDNVKESLYELIERSQTQIIDLVDRTQQYEDYLGALQEELITIREVIDITNTAAENAEKATDDLKTAWETTHLIWKPYVKDKEELHNAYPNPSTGWTTQTTDDGIRWRYDGEKWVPIDILGGSVPLATDEVNGLLSKEDFTKLKNISPEVNIKTIVFILPQENLVGVQDPHVIFPHKGEIFDLEISTTVKGTEDVLLTIEKSNDFEEWESITTEKIVIPLEQNYARDDWELEITEVEEGDIFRVVIHESGFTENISINVNICLDTGLEDEEEL